MQPPEVSVIPTSPPQAEFPPSSVEPSEASAPGSIKSNGTGSSQSRHRRGMSVEKIVGRFWGNAPETEGNANGIKARRPSDASVTPHGSVRKPSTASTKPSTFEVSSMASQASVTDSKASLHSSVDAVKSSEAKKSRRNTLTVMVEPLSKRISQRSRNRASATVVDTPTQTNGRVKEKPTVPPLAVPNLNGKTEEDVPETPRLSRADAHARASAIPASTSKASKVMQWFRQRSKSRAASPSGDYEDRAPTPTADNRRNAMPASAVEPVGPEVVVNAPQTPAPAKKMPPAMMGRSASSHAAAETPLSATPLHNSFVPRTMKRLSNMVSSPQPNRLGYNKNAIRLHHGAVDQTTVTTGSPPDVMAQVTKVLLDMGLEVQQETDYKYRCIRQKRRKAVVGSAVAGVSAFTMVGSAASNGDRKSVV